MRRHHKAVLYVFIEISLHGLEECTEERNESGPEPGGGLEQRPHRPAQPSTLY